eukprot:Tbor_TRINITY_DN3426_c0_g1::TRINITY_DN3426_c0_g1_i1::g.3785::m.3785
MESSNWTDCPLTALSPVCYGGHASCVASWSVGDGKDRAKQSVIVCVGGADPFGIAYDHVHVIEIPKCTNSSKCNNSTSSDGPYRCTRLYGTGTGGGNPFEDSMMGDHSEGEVCGTGEEAHHKELLVEGSPAHPSQITDNNDDAEGISDKMNDLSVREKWCDNVQYEASAQQLGIPSIASNDCLFSPRMGHSIIAVDEEDAHSLFGFSNYSNTNDYSPPMIIFGGMSVVPEPKLHNKVVILQILKNYEDELMKAESKRKNPLVRWTVWDWDQETGVPLSDDSPQHDTPSESRTQGYFSSCTLDPPPCPRQSHCCALLKRCISLGSSNRPPHFQLCMMIATGSNNEEPLSDCYVLDLGTRYWTRVKGHNDEVSAKLPKLSGKPLHILQEGFAEREMASAVAFPVLCRSDSIAGSDGMVGVSACPLAIITGGRDSNGVPRGDIWTLSCVLDDKNDSGGVAYRLSKLPKSFPGRCCHTALAIPCGPNKAKVLLIGGFSSEGLPDKDIYFEMSVCESSDGSDENGRYINIETTSATQIPRRKVKEGGAVKSQAAVTLHMGLGHSASQYVSSCGELGTSVTRSYVIGGIHPDVIGENLSLFLLQ